MARLIDVVKANESSPSLKRLWVAKVAHIAGSETRDTEFIAESGEPTDSVEDAKVFYDKSAVTPEGSALIPAADVASIVWGVGGANGAYVAHLRNFDPSLRVKTREAFLRNEMKGYETDIKESEDDIARCGKTLEKHLKAFKKDYDSLVKDARLDHGASIEEHRKTIIAARSSIVALQKALKGGEAPAKKSRPLAKAKVAPKRVAAKKAASRRRR